MLLCVVCLVFLLITHILTNILYTTTSFKSDMFSIGAVWALGATLAIYCTASISGGHLNPAVTLAFSLSPKRRLSHSQRLAVLDGPIGGRHLGGRYQFILVSCCHSSI